MCSTPSHTSSQRSPPMRRRSSRRCGSSIMAPRMPSDYTKHARRQRRTTGGARRGRRPPAGRRCTAPASCRRASARSGTRGGTARPAGARSATSTTRSARSGSHDRSLVAFQRLGAARHPRPVRLGMGLGVGPLAPRVVGQRDAPQRGDLVDQLAAPGGGERRGHADVVQRPLVVVQAEQQRPDALAVLVPAEPGHHAVGGALVLHLPHRPLVLAVGGVARLGHHAVEPGALEARRTSPRPSSASSVSGVTCTCDRPDGTTSSSRRRRSSNGASRQVAIAQGEQVEGHERRRRLGRQPVDAGRGRVDALLQGVEVEPVARDHHDLAVDHAPLGQRGPQRRRASRGSSGSAAGRCGCRARPRRRRGTRCSGTRPTSARTAGPAPGAPRGPPWPASAGPAASRAGAPGRGYPRRPRRRAPWVSPAPPDDCRPRHVRKYRDGMVDHPMSDRLADLAKRKEEALAPGTDRARERQHDRGKMLARERIDAPARPGLVPRARPAGPPPDRAGFDDRPYTDGVITRLGHGRRPQGVRVLARTSRCSAVRSARCSPRRSTS